MADAERFSKSKSLWERHDESDLYGSLGASISPLLTEESHSRFSAVSSSSATSLAIGTGKDKDNRRSSYQQQGKALRVSLGERIFGSSSSNEEVAPARDNYSYNLSGHPPVQAVPRPLGGTSSSSTSLPLHDETLLEENEQRKAMKRTRTRPQTELQTVGSSLTWLALLLPALVATLFLLISAKFGTFTVRVAPFSTSMSSSASACSNEMVKCVVSLEEERSSSTLRVALRPVRTLNSCKYLQLSLDIATSASLSSEELNSLRAAVRVQFTARQINDEDTKEVFLEQNDYYPIDTMSTQILYSNPQVDLLTPLLLASSRPYEEQQALSVPMFYVSFEEPGVLSGKNQWATAFLELRSEDNGDERHASKIKAETLLKSVSFRLTTQSYALSVLESCIRVVLSGITVAVFVWWCQRTWMHVQLEQTFRKRLEIVLPEQLNSATMLVFLFLWQQPIVCVEAALWATGFSISTTWLLFSGCVQSMAAIGLNFCMLCYVDGLNYAPGERFVDMNKQPEGDEEDDGGGDADDASALGGSSYAALNWMRSSHSSLRASSQHWQASLSRPKLNSRLVGQAAATSSSSSSSSPGRNKLQPQHQASTSGSSSTSQFDISSRSEAQSNPNTPQANGKIRVLLAVHHPLSSEFLDFFVPKLVLLVCSWTIVIAYWLLKFPYSELLLREEKKELTFIALGSAVFFTHLTWAYFIYVAIDRTSKRLQETKYFISRFRQIAFRLLLSQIYLGLFFFSLFGCLRLRECYLIAKGMYGPFPSLFDSQGLLRYAMTYFSAQYLAPFGTFRLVLLVFVSCLSFTIGYALLAPVHDNDASMTTEHQLEGTSHAFVALERHMPYNDSEQERLHRLRRSQSTRTSFTALKELGDELFKKARKSIFQTTNRPSQLFCLEAACSLMEVSYQSYFRPIGFPCDLPSEEGGRRAEASEEVANKGGYMRDWLAGSSTTNEEHHMREQNTKMDLERLNLQLSSTFFDTETSTFGLIAHSAQHDRIVVCFRGSVHLNNLITDFKFSQCALPNLRCKKKQFRDIISQTRLKTKDTSISIVDVEANLSSKTGASVSSDDLDVDAQIAKDKSVVLGREGALRSPSSKASASSTTFYSPATPDSFIDEDLLRSPETTSSRLQFSAGTGSDSRGNNSYYSIPTVGSGENWPGGSSSSSNGGDGGGGGGGGGGGAMESTAAPVQELQNSSSICVCFKSLISSLPVLQQTLPRVHVGFWEAYSSVRRSVLASFVTALYEQRRHLRRLYAHTREGPPPLKIQFTGHSLGGALAVLACLDISTNLESIMQVLHDFDEEDEEDEGFSHPSPQSKREAFPYVCVYTFGTPRIGNSAFRALVKRRVETMYRVEIDGDIVPMMPPNLVFFRHCGRQVVVDPNEAGSLIVKPTIVESLLLSKSSARLDNHRLHRYRACLEACFEPDELHEYLQKEHGRNSAGRNSEQLPSWLM